MRHLFLPESICILIVVRGGDQSSAIRACAHRVGSYLEACCTAGAVDADKRIVGRSTLIQAGRSANLIREKKCPLISAVIAVDEITFADHLSDFADGLFFGVAQCFGEFGDRDETVRVSSKQIADASYEYGMCAFYKENDERRRKDDRKYEIHYSHCNRIIHLLVYFCVKCDAPKNNSGQCAYAAEHTPDYGTYESSALILIHLNSPLLS